MSWTRDSFAKKLEPGEFLPKFLRCSPTVQPYGAGPRVAEPAPKNTLKLRRSEDHSTGTFEAIFRGPLSSSRSSPIRLYG